MPDSQRYPLYLYLINNVEDSLSKFKTFQSDNSFKFSCRNVTFVEKTQLNQIRFQNSKHLTSNSYLIKVSESIQPRESPLLLK